MIKVTVFPPGNEPLRDKNMNINGGAAIHGIKKPDSRSIFHRVVHLKPQHLGYTVTAIKPASLCKKIKEFVSCSVPVLTKILRHNTFVYIDSI